MCFSQLKIVSKMFLVSIATCCSIVSALGCLRTVRKLLGTSILGHFAESYLGLMGIDRN